MKILIVNGPNLNLLGQRDVQMYGSRSFDDYFLELKNQFPGVELVSFQSNVEGELVNAIQQYGFNQDGIILNPAAYTHTSVAIGDAIASIQTPVIEVHISNIHAREDFRKISHVSAKVVGSIVGLGLKGYHLATTWFVDQAASKS